MARMTGKRALMEMLRAEKVQYIFGNPGTSESPIMDALEDYPDLKYVLVLQEGVATKEDIDECVRLGLNHPMGPFQLMDLVGLDITLHEIASTFEYTGDSKYRPSTLLQKMVKAGLLGRKTGRTSIQPGFPCCKQGIRA